MSAIASMLVDDSRMMRGIFGETDPMLKRLQEVGLPMDALTQLLEAQLLDTDATTRVRAYLGSLTEYHSVRLRISPLRATAYPFSRMPSAGELPEDDRQWARDGNLFHHHTMIGGTKKSEQALYLWLCLAAQSTAED